MRYVLAAFLLLATLMTWGCGSSKKPSVPENVYSAGEAFIANGKPVEAGGTVKVENVDGVPQLTVDVRGKKP